MSVLDRYILRSLLFNYGVALASMLSLYVVLDMFVNMDEFTEQGYPLLTVVRNIADYYWPNLFLYFSQLSGVITLFACTATIARMRKLNEMTAILASGVSLFRVACPVAIFGILTTGLLIVDTEWVIPSIAHKLSRDHDDADGRRAYEVLFLRDREGRLLSARRFLPTERDLHDLLILTRDREGTILQTLEADRAVWEPPDETHLDGRWRLDRSRLTARVVGGNVGLGPRSNKQVTYPRYYDSDLSPEAIQLQQSEGWIRFLSLKGLAEMEARAGRNLANIIQTRHARQTAPIVNLVLLLLGLPFFLDRSPGTVLSDAGKCMVACGLCYVISLVTQSLQLGVASALPAWIPIFIFGTLGVVLFDRIRT